MGSEVQTEFFIFIILTAFAILIFLIFQDINLVETIDWFLFLDLDGSAAIFMNLNYICQHLVDLFLVMILGGVEDQLIVVAFWSWLGPFKLLWLVRCVSFIIFNVECVDAFYLSWNFELRLIIMLFVRLSLSSLIRNIFLFFFQIATKWSIQFVVLQVFAIRLAKILIQITHHLL